MYSLNINNVLHSSFAAVQGVLNLNKCDYNYVYTDDFAFRRWSSYDARHRYTSSFNTIFLPAS